MLCDNGPFAGEPCVWGPLSVPGGYCPRWCWGGWRLGIAPPPPFLDNLSNPSSMFPLCWAPTCDLIHISKLARTLSHTGQHMHLRATNLSGHFRDLSVDYFVWSFIEFSYHLIWKTQGESKWQMLHICTIVTIYLWPCSTRLWYDMRVDTAFVRIVSRKFEDISQWSAQRKRISSI